MLEFIQTLVNQALAQGKRSSALKPVIVPILILAGAVIFAGYYKLPEWTLEILLWFLGGTLVVCLYTIMVFVHKNPDALRSEQFVLNKMTIQQSKMGDSSSGVKKLDSNGESVSKIKPAEVKE